MVNDTADLDDDFDGVFDHWDVDDDNNGVWDFFEVDVNDDLDDDTNTEPLGNSSPDTTAMIRTMTVQIQIPMGMVGTNRFGIEADWDRDCFSPNTTTLTMTTMVSRTERTLMTTTTES